MEGSGLALGGLMARKTKPWHEREHYQHGEVNGTGDPVSASQVLAKRSALKRNRKPQLRADQKRQCQEADAQRAAMHTSIRKLAQHIACSQEDDDSHERHFRQFGPTFAYAWNEERNSNHAEQEPCAEHEGKVDESSTDDAQHGVRGHDGAQAGPKV